MGKKIIRNDIKLKATKIFTDRQEPRDAFWNKYNFISEHMEDDEVSVLSYYGIGGIGKTSLCKKIIEEIKERKPKTKYIYVDFNDRQDAKNVLANIKNDLTKRYNFSFFLFDYALYSHEIKCGKNIEKPEIQSIISSSKSLSLIFDVADSIPLISTFSGIMKSTDAAFTLIRNLKNKYKKEISEIEAADILELKKKLPIYFAEDMVDNIKNEKEPFVVIMDTYEKLVNEMSSIGEPLMNDLWIRSDENGIVTRIPNTLWVIAGRESLKWKRFDASWDENCLEQHIMGDLSEADSVSFLELAGIAEPELRLAIYELTKGVPFHLDMCVDTYQAINNKGESPSIEAFEGNIDLLAERFIRYMDHSEQDIIYTLVCMEQWSDHDFYTACEHMKLPFSMITYEKIKNLSFVISSEDKDVSYYYMHQKVQEILSKTCQKPIRDKYILYLKERLKDDSIPLDYKVLKGLINNSDIISSEEKLYELICLIEKPLKEYIENYELVVFETVFEKLWKITQKYHNNTRSCAIVEVIYATYLIRKNSFSEAISVCTKLLDNAHLLNEEQIIFCNENLSYAYGKISKGQDFQKAIDYANKAIELREKNLDKYENDLPIAYNALAYAYYAMDNYEEAIELYEKSKTIRMKYYGDTHQRVVGNENNIAEIYVKMGEFLKAEEIFKRCHTILMNTKGESYPYTMICENNLINCQIQNNVEEIDINHLEELYDKMTAVFGEKSDYSIQIISTMGDYYKKIGKNKEAIDLYNKAYDKYVQYFGDEHHKTKAVLKKLGQL